MKRYEIHGSDFYKMNDFMSKITLKGVKFNVIRINGYFLDVEDESVKKYEKIATDMGFNIKSVDTIES